MTNFTKRRYVKYVCDGFECLLGTEYCRKYNMSEGGYISNCINRNMKPRKSFVVVYNNGDKIICNNNNEKDQLELNDAINKIIEEHEKLLSILDDFFMCYK